MNTGNDSYNKTYKRPSSADPEALFSTKVRIPVTGIKNSVEKTPNPRRPYDIGDPEIIRNNLEIRSLRAALVAKYK